MSTDTTTLWNLSKPKHNEVTGEINQVFGKPSSDSILQWIKAGNLAGLATVDFNGQVVYVWNPQVHNNLAGDPIKIVGNASNKKGEFSMIEMSLDALKYFALPMLKNQAPAGMYSDTALTKTIYEGTKWQQNGEGTMVVALIPKIVPIFFGMSVPHGSLHDDEVAADFAELGKAYEVFANSVVAYQDGDTSQDAETIVQKLKGMPDGLKQFIDDDIPTKKQLGINGPTISTTHADSSKYPEIANTIRNFFAPDSSASNNNFFASTLGQTRIVVRSSDDEDKEAIANDGLTKLQLFYLAGIVTDEGRRIDNAQLATISPSFRNIVSAPKNVRTQRLKSLITTGLDCTNKANPLDTMAKTTMKVVQDTLCSFILNARFATKPVFIIQDESHELELGAFLPQSIMDQKVLRIKSQEDGRHNETLMGLSDALKTTPSTMIQRLGNINDMSDIVKLIVNFINVSHSLVDMKAMEAKGATPIILQLMQRMLEMLCATRTEDWLKQTSESNRHVPWNVFANLDAFFASFGAAANNWANIQAASSLNPDVSTLEMDSYTSATEMLTLYMRSLHQLRLLNAVDSQYSRLVPPIFNKTLVPRSQSSAENSAGGGKKREGENPARANNDSSSKKTRTNGGGGGGGDTKSTNRKPSTGPVRENQSGSDKAKLGWCFSTAGGIDKLVPATGMGDQAPCPYFITQGYSCSHSATDCPHGKHTRTPNKIDEESILAFAKHLSDNGYGHFNRKSIERYGVKIPEDLNVLGNKDGLTQPNAST